MAAYIRHCLASSMLSPQSLKPYRQSRISKIILHFHFSLPILLDFVFDLFINANSSSTNNYSLIFGCIILRLYLKHFTCTCILLNQSIFQSLLQSSWCGNNEYTTIKLPYLQQNKRTLWLSTHRDHSHHSCISLLVLKTNMN